VVVTAWPLAAVLQSSRGRDQASGGDPREAAIGDAVDVAERLDDGRSSTAAMAGRRMMAPKTSVP
jgi:hypothetical protein